MPFLIFALSASAAQINLQAGESLTLKPQQETTVTCAGGSAGGGSKKEGSPKCGLSSDDACRGMSVGDLCNRDEMRGSCVPKKSIHGLDCSCLLF